MFHILENNARPEHGPLPDTLQQLIEECIDGNPEVRPDMDEIISRLERIQQLDVDMESILDFKRSLQLQ
jgi:hypothetical protein